MSERLRLVIACSHEEKHRNASEFPALVTARMRTRLAAAAVFVLALAYYAAFLRFGFNLDEEGTLLYQFARLSEGQRIYQDFHAGYTPGVYYLHSWLQGLFEQSLLPGRISLALANSLSAALLVLIVTPLAGLTAAVASALLYVASMPVHAGSFALFNVPYPSWYSVAVFLAGLLPARRFLQAPGLGAALAAGAVAGLGFFFKPNVGAFQLACAMLLVLSALPRAATAPGTRLSAAWWWTVWGCVVAALLAVFGLASPPSELVLLLLPALACAALTVRLSGTDDRAERDDRVVLLTSAVAVGFCVVTAAWLAPLALRLPTDVLLERVLFIGSDYVPFFYQPHPAVLASAALLAAGYSVAVVAAKSAAARGYRSGVAVLVATVLCGIALLGLLLARPMVQGFSASVMSAFETLWSYRIAVATHWLLLALTWQAARARTTGGPSRDELSALLPVTFGSVFLYLQIYPRTDFSHWVWAAPLSMAGALFLLTRLARAWTDAGLVRSALTVALLAPALLLIGLRAGDSLSTITDGTGAGLGPPPALELDLARAPVWNRLGDAERYRDLQAVVETLQSASAPDQAAVGFPVVDAVLFLAGRPTPLGDSFFFPGWLGRDDEAAAVAALEKQRPRLAVVLRESRPFFDAAPAYYLLLAEHFKRDYRHYRYAGRYEVLIRRDAAEVAQPSPEIPRGAPALVLQRYIHGRLAGGVEQRLEALRTLGDDRVEGYYPELSAQLQDAEPRVRAAAVQALRSAGDDRSAHDLAEAAVGSGLQARDRALALRLAAAWAGASTAQVLLPLATTDDLSLREAARTALDNYSRRRFVESFWFAYPPRPDSVSLTEERKIEIRAWLRDGGADPRLKNFAIAVAGYSGGLDEVLDALAEACPAASAELAGSANPCLVGAAATLSRFAPGLRLQAALLAEIAVVRHPPSDSAGTPVAYALALDLAGRDDLFGPAVALRFLRKDPAAAATLQRVIASSASPMQRRNLAYLATLLAAMPPRESPATD